MLGFFAECLCKLLYPVCQVDQTDAIKIANDQQFFLFHFLIFSGFCLRFAEEFEVNLDDWKPDMIDLPVMNACVVEKGTYKVCSKTTPKTPDGTS